MTTSGVLSRMSLNRNTWEDLSDKSYLQVPSLLFVLLLLDHHLGQQVQDLLCSPSHPAVHASLQGQDHSSDASLGVVPSQCQQQATQLSCGHEPNSALHLLESGASGSGGLAHHDQCTLTFEVRFFFQLSFAFVHISFI